MTDRGGGRLAGGASYERLGWSLIEDHINFTLGRLCAHLQELEHAVGFFVQLLGESQQPVARQQTFLHEFLYLVKTLLGEQGKREFTNLPLPRVSTSDITVYAPRSVPVCAVAMCCCRRCRRCCWWWCDCAAYD